MQPLGDVNAQRARPRQRDGLIGLLDRAGPGLTDHGVLVLAGMGAGEESFGQGWHRVVVGVGRDGRLVHGVGPRMQGVVQLLPEHRGPLRLASVGNAPRVTAPIPIGAVRQHGVVPRPRQRHVSQSPFVGVQTTPVLVLLGQVPVVRVRVLHTVADLTQRAEYLVVDLDHVLQACERFHRILPRLALVGEPWQDIRIDAYRGRHACRIGQPDLRVGLPIFRRRPHAIDQPAGMGLIQLDVQPVLAVIRHDARREIDDGHGIPFQSLGLVDGHQFHIGLFVIHRGRLVLDGAQLVQPGQEAAQRRRAAVSELLDVGVGQIGQRVHRHSGHGGVRRLLAALHGLGHDRVDVEVQGAHRGTDHLGQRMAHHRLHRAQYRPGVQHPRLAALVEASFAFEQLFQIVALQHIAEEHHIGHLVAMLPHGRVALLRRAVAAHHASLDQRAESHPRVLPFGERRQAGQGLARQVESGRGQQTHQVLRVVMLHDDMQQRQHVADLRTFQHRRVSDDERRHPRLFQRLLVFGHGALGTEQHGHGAAVLHIAVLHDGVAADGLTAEAHDAVNLLPQCPVADHTDGALIGLGNVRQRGHVDLTQRGAARAAWHGAQRQRQIVRRFKHDPRVAPGRAQRIRHSAGRHAEIPFEHAEGTRTGAAPGVDRLERIAHGADRAA